MDSQARCLNSKKLKKKKKERKFNLFFNFVTACSFVLSVQTRAGKVRIRHALQCLPLEKELQMLKSHENNDPHPIRFPMFPVCRLAQFLSGNTIHVTVISEKSDTEIKPRCTC